MKKSCPYCNRFHGKNEECDKKPKKLLYAVPESKEYKFRSKSKWRVKRGEIKRRDGYMCRACLEGLSGTVRRINPYGLSVHHIVPLCEDISKGLDSGNLITLCSYHHEQAESGKISREILFRLAENPPIPENSDFQGVLTPTAHL